jgi:hypothetical protein
MVRRQPPHRRQGNANYERARNGFRNPGHQLLQDRALAPRCEVPVRRSARELKAGFNGAWISSYLHP